MAYGGGASAFAKWDQAFDKPLVYSYGTGFRYLIARKFKLRMGVHVAKGPEQWAYYIVFGSNWLRLFSNQTHLNKLTITLAMI